jgi:hypothetical protein
MFNNGLKLVKIELIENFPCYREYTSRIKQAEIVNKMINDIKMNKNEYIYTHTRINKIKK